MIDFNELSRIAPDVAGPIGSLRCVGYHANGEVVGVLRVHRPGQPAN